MFFNQNKEDVVKALGSSSINGLSDEEVLKRQASYGLNQLSSQKKQSIVVKFLLQFIDPLIILLLVAALVSIIVDPGEWVDSLIILIVVIFNAVLGVYQENSAEKSLEALKRLSAPSAKVIRNGERLTIDAKELTVGDIVIIEAGDYIPSDGRIIEAYNLQIDESSLTGESIAVNKNTDIIEDDDVSLADQKNMAFASTVCTYGRGKMIITSVGMNNEVGKIAGMLQENSDQSTPLQLKMAQISKVIGIMCVLICVIVFGLEWLNGESVLVAFKTAVALAVAAIPEGLATVVTIVLSIGVTKMVKNNAIVKKLPAVETLGSANVVCSDKTGTLTQNKMTVVKTYLPEYGIKKFDDHEHADDVKKMLRYFTLCSDAELKIDNGEIVLFGDPTETAMVYASYLLNDTKENLYQEYKRTCELSFDSKRKMMSVFYETKDGIYSFTKGAPDEILRRSNNVNKKDFEAYEQMADEALRVLAVGIRKWDSIPDNLSSDNVENDLSFIGMIGMIDPPRVEVKAAINEAKMGGIVTVMITGDHITTAKAIASELGILTAGKKAITGKQLDAMDDNTLDKEIADIAVYARVAPEHKVRIVKAWQRKNAVVAMTGDGVNDSPALKAADIGCAMGITGTDVSKESADMILTDDNFATIIKAVKQGRGIYQNIKKDVQFLLSSNIGEVITIFLASVIGVFGYSVGVPLSPVHLLWVNLITDTLPAFALGMEEIDDDVMKEKPRSKDESFFANGLGWTICYQGVMIGLLTLCSYLIGNSYSHEVGQSMAFVTLAISQLLHAFNIKSDKSVFNKQVFNNKYLWLSLIVGLLLQSLIMYVPFFSSIFGLAALDGMHIMVALGLAACPVVMVEIVKLVKRVMK